MIDFTQILQNFVIDIGTSFGAVIVGIVSFLAGLIALGMGIRYFVGLIVGDGTTTRFSVFLDAHFPSIGSAWDRMTYRPYKGYNRLHSRKWNMEHTFK